MCAKKTSSSAAQLKKLAAKEGEIRLNFQNANQVVSDLRSIARDTRNAANEQLQGALNRVDQSWHGENSEEFLRKGSQLKSQVVAAAADVDKIANTIEQIATTTYNAEMKAVRIARQRIRK